MPRLCWDYNIVEFMPTLKAVILVRDSMPWFSNGSVEQSKHIRLLNRHFLEHQVDALRRAGIENICVICPSGYFELFGQEFKGVYFKSQNVPVGSAGSLREISDWIGESIFLLVYGSTYIEPKSLVHFLNEEIINEDNWAGNAATNPQSRQLGLGETIQVRGERLLKEIHRRYDPVCRRTNLVLTGLFLLSPKILAYIPADIYYDLKEQLFPKLLDLGLSIKLCSAINCFAVCTPEVFLRLHFDLLNSLAESNPKNSSNNHFSVFGYVKYGKNCVIDTSAMLVGPIIIGSNCIIEAGAKINGPTVIGDDCQIKANAIIQSSCIGSRVYINPESHVNFSILGDSHEVEESGRRYFVFASEVGVELKIGFPFSPTTVVDSQKLKDQRIALAQKELYFVSKRIFDIAVCSTLLVLTLPVWMLIAVAIKLDSSGPVVFKQARCGRYGQPFQMLKFRTMSNDADKIQNILRAKNEVDGPVFKIENDPRITKIGRFLRKTSLDELPQLLNVLYGEMSLVGPRPLVMKEMGLNPHWRDMRLSVKPGITGLWQVMGRTSNNFHRWVDYDIKYVRNRSILLDIKILLQTIKILRTGK